MKQHIYKKSIILFFTIIVTIISIIGLVNYSIDPYGTFNSSKAQFLDKSRITDSMRLHNTKYSNIIIGTSRTESGIDSRNKSFKGSTYNASMSR